MPQRHAAQIRAVCRTHHYELIDTYDAFRTAIAASHPARFVAADDGVHPTDAGDVLWAETVERWFDRS